jgi:hypothetical protein
MASSTKRLTLEEIQKARNEYLLARRQRAGALKADIAMPDVPGIIDASDGTLSADAVRAPLEVIIPEWDQYADFTGDQDVVSLEWAPGHNPAPGDFKVVDDKTLTAPINPVVDFPVTLHVPVAEMSPDGPYTLRYHILTANGEDARCANIPIICDSMPPWKHYEPGKMVLPVTQLTDAELATMPNGMVAKLADYAHADWQAGDKVAFYWIAAPLDPDKLPLPVNVAGVSGAVAPEVTYPLATLQLSEDKDYYAVYILMDKAGNRSPLSDFVRVDVALGPLPSGLQLPVVPLAPPDGEVNQPDATAGVYVHIPSFSNYKPRDRIEVTWGTHVLDSEEIGAAPTFPFPVKVPSPVLVGQYNLQTGGAQPTNVSYRVLRGKVPSAEQAITIDVDLSYIGPVNPDWPNPINPALPEPQVFGKKSNTLNVLTRADVNENAELRFDLYAPVNEGEVIDFYWGSQLVTEAQYTVKPGDSAGDPIVREIPWLTIKNEGNNPALPVYYSIHAPGSENEQHCTTIYVDVDVVTLVPEAPVFEGTNPANGWLTCVSLYADPANPDPLEPAVRVRVPDLSQHLVPPATVTVTWTALSGRTGETPIPGAEKTEDIVLDATTVKGFLWLVQPYTTYILPTYDPAGAGNTGRGRIKYEFIKAGETITSDTTEAVVAMYNAGGSCPIPPTP